MKILAIDTSNMPLTVAVLDDERLLATMTTTARRDHGATLMPVIAALLERAAVSVDEIDRFVVCESEPPPQKRWRRRSTGNWLVYPVCGCWRPDTGQSITG